MGRLSKSEKYLGNLPTEKGVRTKNKNAIKSALMYLMIVFLILYSLLIHGYAKPDMSQRYKLLLIVTQWVGK